MVYRVYVEKKPALAHEAATLLHEAQELLQIRGLKGHLSRRGIEAVLEGVAIACSLPKESLPQLPKRPKGEAKVDGVVDLMAAVVDLRAHQNDVAPQVLASRDDLTRMARGHRSDIAALEGWRRDMVGNELVDLLEGRLALFIRDGEIVVQDR